MKTMCRKYGSCDTSKGRGHCKTHTAMRTASLPSCHVHRQDVGLCQGGGLAAGLARRSRPDWLGPQRLLCCIHWSVTTSFFHAKSLLTEC